MPDDQNQEELRYESLDAAVQALNQDNLDVARSNAEASQDEKIMGRVANAYANRAQGREAEEPMEAVNDYQQAVDLFYAADDFSGQRRTIRKVVDLATVENVPAFQTALDNAIRTDEVAGDGARNVMLEIGNKAYDLAQNLPAENAARQQLMEVAGRAWYATDSQELRKLKGNDPNWAQTYTAIKQYVDGKREEYKVGGDQE
jgi:hypothetical protein